MSATANLQSLLQHSAAAFPDRIAIDEPGGSAISYRELLDLSERLRDRLVFLGVRPGDRVGIYVHKSIEAVASIFGILQAGAAYVPVDPDGPPERCAYIFNDCAVRAIVCEVTLRERIQPELERLGAQPALLALEDGPAPGALHELLASLQAQQGAPSADTVHSKPDELAYILYTSGSTGRPKGVMLTQLSATSYVDWCTDIFDPNEHDCFSSHAPLHFDLSILDVFVCIKHGARLVPIGEKLGKDPLALAPMIAEKRITVWYSTPSILSFLAQYGKLERYDYSALRLVLFAGEVFPVAQLRELKQLWPHPRYFNLYGPTETNVCTYYEIPAVVPEDRTEPYPIGHTCSHLRARVVDPDGHDVDYGDEGELLIAGAGVMAGYWNLPKQNADAFLVDEPYQWYRTGDLVVDSADGYIFHGRRDRMVKRRGYRVELGEIEAGLATHPAVREVAVVAQSDEDSGVRITAVLSSRDGERLSVIELKQFCVRRLPGYMVPDVFRFVEALPRTSTDKIDYQTLKR